METTGPPIDTADMGAVHTFFRRELRLAGAAVRGVAPGDVARARVVGDHLELVTRCLHHHHQVEDELLWPLLLQRVPDQLAPVVHLMQSQHGRLDTLLARVARVRPGWQAAARVPARDELAELLDAVYVHLVEHLDAEEDRLLPIAARAVTEHEWAALGEESRRRGRRSEMLLVLGMYAYEGDPVVVARMLSRVPAPVRWLAPRLSRRAFRRRAVAVHGTSTP